MSDPSTQRRVGVIAATAIVVANMIGTGVFTTTGFMVLNLEASDILINWLIGGVMALCGATVYAELGAMMPRVGGEYVYLREAFHPIVGFMSGWVSLIVGFSAPIAAAALAFDKYTLVLIPSMPAKYAALGLIVGITALHTINVVLGSAVQTVFTAVKVGLILVFIGAGLLVGDGDWSHLDTALPGVDSSVFSMTFATSLVYVSFSYSGWNAAAYIAGEVEDPGRNLPRALLIGTAIVTVLYMLLNLVFLYAAPASALAGKPEVGDVAATALFGGSAGKLLSILIALALVSAVSAMVMAGPRVYAAMAEDGLFFRGLARRNDGGAPMFSVLLQGGIAFAFVIWGDFDKLLNYIGFTLGIFAALTVIGQTVLRFRDPDAQRPYRALLWPAPSIIFVGLTGWMVYFLIDQRPEETLMWSGVTVAVGAALYVVWQFLSGDTRRSA